MRDVTTDANGVVISELRYKPWGETRYALGTSPTKYTFTGQYSHTSDFGLMFYNARWVDVSLGRFVQADIVVPNSIQGLDRFAYVGNNPVRYTDPSGHCRMDDEPDECFVPGKKYPKTHGSDVISAIAQPAGLTQSGAEAYNGLMTLVSMNNAWWNEDGKLTVQEALAMLLFREVSVTANQSCDVNGNCQFNLPGAVMTAATAKWQQYCSAGWGTANCLNGFWGYYQATIDISKSTSLQQQYLDNNLNNLTYYGDVYIREAGNMISSPTIPIANNTPIGWANVKSTSSVASALNIGVSYRQAYYDGGSTLWIFFVVSGEEQDNICSKLNQSPGCNLSNIEP